MKPTRRHTHFGSDRLATRAEARRWAFLTKVLRLFPLALVLCRGAQAGLGQPADKTKPTGNTNPPPTLIQAANREAGRQKGTFLALFLEPYQGAFYMLIPKDWRTEGGMVPSGVPGNRVDLMESNIRFRATSPDGKAFFGWYPKFYFYDPQFVVQSSGGLLRPQVGTMYNGFWLYPYLSVPQFVEKVVFGQFAAKEFEQPRLLGGFHETPELRAWVPASVTTAQCGYVDFECAVKGTRMRGRIYAILTSLGAGTWSNSGTFGWLAPQERWQEEGRLMERCLRTFKLNPDWVRRAAAAEMRRANQMRELETKLAEEDAKRQREHLAHSSDSQNEFYKVLTGQMETRDAATGRESWAPAYHRAYTDGNGNYYLTDEPGNPAVENNPAWRKLEIINRNETR